MGLPVSRTFVTDVVLSWKHVWGYRESQWVYQLAQRFFVVIDSLPGRHAACVFPRSRLSDFDRSRDTFLQMLCIRASLEFSRSIPRDGSSIVPHSPLGLNCDTHRSTHANNANHNSLWGSSVPVMSSLCSASCNFNPGEPSLRCSPNIFGFCGIQ